MSPLLVSDHRGDAAEDAGMGRPRLPEQVSTCLDVSISLQPPWPGQLNMKCLQDVDRSATAEGASVSVTIIWTIHHENRETNIHPAGDRCTTAALHYNITVTSDSVLMSSVFMRHLHYNSGCIISRPSGLSWLYHKTAALEWPGVVTEALPDDDTRSTCWCCWC